MQDFFADGLGNISVTNGLVRLEFVSQRMPTREGEPARPEPVLRLVVPLGGFLAALNLQEQARAQLIKDGTLKPVPAAVADTADSATPPA
jgi:hypothetical protein